MSTVSTVKAIQRPNGEWTVEGLGQDRYIGGLQSIINMLHPYNVSFYMTTKAKECIDRLSRNQSDFSNAYSPIQTISPEYHVPEVFFAGKVQFITGYNLSEHATSGEETATALANVRLLETQVYLCSFLLTLAFIGFIITRIWLFSDCLLYTSPSPRDGLLSRMPSSA